jgi:hypothetical protein
LPAQVDTLLQDIAHRLHRLPSLGLADDYRRVLAAWPCSFVDPLGILANYYSFVHAIYLKIECGLRPASLKHDRTTNLPVKRFSSALSTDEGLAFL